MAAQAVQAGDCEVVVAGGAENMSRAPYLLEQARDGYGETRSVLRFILPNYAFNSSKTNLMNGWILFSHGSPTFQSFGNRLSTRYHNWIS